MTYLTLLKSGWRTCVCGACLTMLVSSAAAEEPIANFLEALRDRRYFDTAVEYIEQMKDSPVAPARFKQVASYEMGTTLVSGAKYIRDFQLREKQLNQALAALDEFIKTSEGHQLEGSAKNQLGNVTVERARLLVERAKKPAEAANKEALITKARELYDEAYKVFNTLSEDLREKLKGIPTHIDEKKDAKLFELREQYRADFLQAELLSAAVLEEHADAIGKTHKDTKAMLEKSAKEYGTLYEKYRTRLAGLYARMYQGRCFQKLGSHKDALSYFGEILSQPDEPRPFHELKTKCLLLAMDSWDASSLFSEASQKGAAWVDKAYSHEAKSEEFMELRLKTAVAMKKFADSLRAKDAKTNDKQISQLMTLGGKILQVVARNSSSDFNKEAVRLMPDFGRQSGSATAGRKEPKDFANAIEFGKEAIDEVKVAKQTLDSYPQLIKVETDAAKKKEMQDQLADAQEATKNGHADAMYYFRRALELVAKEKPKDTDAAVKLQDDLNLVYYLLSYLYYVQEEFADAAVMGEFLARRFPDSSGAKPAAKIAMASYLKVYSDTKTNAKTLIDKALRDYDKDKDDKLTVAELATAPEAERSELLAADLDKNSKIDQLEMMRVHTQFESNRIVGICTYISEKWKDTIEAQESLGTLISFMITEGELQKAQDYLAQIPEDSAQRGKAELLTGQAMWSAYLRGSQSVREQEEKAAAVGTAQAAIAAQVGPRKAELQELKSRSETILEAGVKRMKDSGKIDATFVTAALGLGQLYVDTNQAMKAIEILADEKTGPLVLVRANHEAMSKKGMPEETYKTALRAYISSMSAGADSASAMGKAKEIMESLKSTVGGTEEGHKQLIAIYVSLARDLEQQMKLASPENRKSLATGFQTFLDEVSKGTKEKDVLFWVASMFKGMGESSGDPSKPDAQAFFKKSLDTYKSIMDRAEKKEFVLDSDLRLQIMQERAKTHRAIGEYEESLKLFRQILTEKNVLLSVQVEAATTYQKWAVATGDAKKFAGAMSGEGIGANKVIWGWGELAKRTAGKSQFHNSFYDARYNLVVTQIQYAKSKKKEEQKKEYERALSYLSQTVQLYPKLDGDGTPAQKNFRAEYDAVLKQIQTALGQPAVGLSALARPATPTAPGTPATPAAPVPPAKSAASVPASTKA